MSLTALVFQQAEVWTDAACRDGTRVAVARDLTTCTASVALEGDGKLTVSVPVGSTFADACTGRRVLRVVESASVFDEWRILADSRRLSDGLLTVTAVPIAYDLGDGTLVARVDADGARVYDFDAVGLTPQQHLDTYILPALEEVGMDWVAAGTVEPTAPVDVAYRADSPLSALQKLASVAGVEFALRRSGTTEYLVDLVDEVGSTAPQVDVRYGKNLQDLERGLSRAEQQTRVFPFGAALDGVRGTMARAVWAVTNVASTVVTLADPAGGDGPVAVDGQLVGAYLRTAAGTLTLVTDSSAAAQTVTVASASGITAGDRIQFRADSDGTDLTWLDHPTEIAAAGGLTGGGVKVGQVDAQDVAATNNVIPNAACRTWPSGTLPTGWAAAGSPTTSQNTASPYTALGGKSIAVTTAADGDGVESPDGPLTPTSLARYLSGYASLWVVSGTVRVELVLTTAGGEVTIPPAPYKATTTLRGQFESLGASGIDAFTAGATAVRVRVVQEGADAATFYVDAAQATETAAQQPLAEGSGGTVLWQRANRRLLEYGAPVLAFDAPLADLARVDGATWGSDHRVTLGGTLRLECPPLDLTASPRVVGVEVDYLDRASTRVTIATRPPALSDSLVNGPKVTAPAVTPERTPPVDTPPATGGSGGGGTNTVTLYAGGADLVLDAAAEFPARARAVVTSFSHARVFADVRDAAAGATADLFWMDGATKTPVGVGGTTPSVPLSAAGVQTSGFVALHPDCTGDVEFGCDVAGASAEDSAAVRNLAVEFLAVGPRAVAEELPVYPYCLTGDAPSGWASTFDFADAEAAAGALGYRGTPGSGPQLMTVGDVSGAMITPNGPPDGIFPEAISQGSGSCGGATLGKLYYGWASGIQLQSATNMPATANGWLRFRFRSSLGGGNYLSLPFLSGNDDGGMSGIGFAHYPGGSLMWESWDDAPAAIAGSLSLGGPVDVVLNVAVGAGGRSLVAHAWGGAVSTSGDFPAYLGSYTYPQYDYDPELPDADNPPPITALVQSRGLWANTSIGMTGTGSGTLAASVVGSLTWELCEYVRGEDNPDPFHLLVLAPPV